MLKEKLFLVGIHPDCHNPGEPAEIIDAAPISIDNNPPTIRVVIEYADGHRASVIIINGSLEKNYAYKLLTESELLRSQSGSVPYN